MTGKKRTYVPARRVFTDRWGECQAFGDIYAKAHRNPEDYYVLSLYGRSRFGNNDALQRICNAMWTWRLDGGIYVFYDLEEGAKMQQTLTGLRDRFLSKYPERFSFEHFDSALTPEAFSEDLARCCKCLDQPVVIFLGSYERLSDDVSAAGIEGCEDLWLRDTVIRHVPGSVWVLAGRERLRWKEIDENWKNAKGFIDHFLNRLEKNDVFRYLQGEGIDDETLCEQIFAMTDGKPLYLYLIVSTWQNLTADGVTPRIEDFGSYKELVERYLRDMDPACRNTLGILADLVHWTDDEVQEKARQLMGTFDENAYQAILESALVKIDGADGYELHSDILEAVRFPERWKQTSIDVLGLSLRSCNCLMRAGILTVEDLRMLSDDDLKHIRNLGKKNVEEIQQKLAEFSD